MIPCIANTVFICLFAFDCQIITDNNNYNEFHYYPAAKNLHCTFASQFFKVFYA